MPRAAEQQRKPDDDVIEALEGTGVFRSFVPKQYGGYEIDLELFVDIGVAVSEACPSTGLDHHLLHGAQLAARHVRRASVQREIFSSQPYVLAPGTVNPSGEAVRRDDHYELSGQWQFGTGIVHADWVLLSGRIVGDESRSRACSSCRSATSR